VVLHLLRIVQEAIHNAMRHSGAGQIWIRAEHDPSSACLRLSVRDDGCGLPPGLPQGRGLSNMQHRAREIGARLDLHAPDHGQGTVVDIVWPLA
jgi:signal transduction histidine kinase